MHAHFPGIGNFNDFADGEHLAAKEFGDAGVGRDAEDHDAAGADDQIRAANDLVEVEMVACVFDRFDLQAGDLGGDVAGRVPFLKRIVEVDIGHFLFDLPFPNQIFFEVFPSFVAKRFGEPDDGCLGCVRVGGDFLDRIRVDRVHVF